MIAAFLPAARHFRVVAESAHFFCNEAFSDS
jgi:hypothetical protein